MSTEASELHRIISASVRDMLDAFRIQAQAGPVTDKALRGVPARRRRTTPLPCLPWSISGRSYWRGQGSATGRFTRRVTPFITWAAEGREALESRSYQSWPCATELDIAPRRRPSGTFTGS